VPHFCQLLAEVGTSALSRFISSPGVQASVEIDEVAVQLDALDRFGRTKAHFVDCLLAATVVAEDLPVASFDHDFRKFGDVRVEAE
jgi:predicted nucleic acid-binding protein